MRVKYANIWRRVKILWVNAIYSKVYDFKNRSNAFRPNTRFAQYGSSVMDGKPTIQLKNINKGNYRE